MRFWKQLASEMEHYAAFGHVPIISQAGAALLTQVAVAQKPRRVLEVGTAIGYSAILLLSHLPEESKLVSIELNTERLAAAKMFLTRAQLLHRVELIAGDAACVLPELTGRFDMVFLDAAKGQYLDYLDKIMDKLAAGAVIVADNVLFRGWILSAAPPPRRFRTIVKRLRAYLDFVSHDPRFRTHIYEIGDGMVVSYYQRSDELDA